MHLVRGWALPILLLFWQIVHGQDTLNVLLRATTACASIATNTSSASHVYYAVSLNYLSDNRHYMLSSSQAPVCIVEVGSTEDTAQVIKIIGSSRSPFAVIAGGHASNPGFSSTSGVLISLVRLKNFTPAADYSSITLGTGNIWTKDVYPKLDGSGYNVVGGRVTGPAVGGLTLGGGFSWLTNQYGLTCDTVLSYTLVLPDGTVSEVDSKQPELFFALKGGLNRFGIVTQIKLRLFPEVPKVIATNNDPKAQIILTLAYLAGTPNTELLIFYDGPTPPPSLAPFKKIPALFTDVSTRTFSDFANSVPDELTANTRGAFHTLSTNGYTKAFIEAVRNETVFYGSLSALHSGIFISYDIEPFLGTYGQKATDSAYPHAKSPLPLNLYFTWINPAEDAFWRGKMQQSVDTLTAVAKREGIFDPDLTAYPNYALSTYTGDQLYGSVNAARLRDVKAAVDPQGVMDLTGGFHL